MKNFTEFIEIEGKKNELLVAFEEKKVPAEVPDGWYCGVTGQETSQTKFELERIKEHYDDNFPELDIDSICKVKVSSPDIALKIEARMEETGFDIGKRQNEPTDKNQIWVYIFRKKV